MEAARQELGKPFSIGCRDGRATDCGGLIVDVARACGYNYRDVPAKYNTAQSAGLALYVHLRQCGNEVRPAPLVVGDVILFWIRKRTYPQHLGIWTGSSIIHATPRERKVTERSLGSLADRLFAVFQMRGRKDRPAHEVPLNENVRCERCVLESPAAFAYPAREGKECTHV